ncbi:MAG: hypothetical protein OXF45_01925 [Candidatus Dadabacteria bacterium]|nr:hypothetical protein [Candidatus Dadabacteria bacterium]
MGNSEEISDYRKHLVREESLLSSSYDKLVVSIATGSIWVSIVFMDRIIGCEQQIQSKYFLGSSWVFFLLAICSVLLGIFFGIKAHREAIKQVDNKLIWEQIPGGNFAKYAKWFHQRSLLFLLTGLCLMFAFVYATLGVK